MSNICGDCGAPYAMEPEEQEWLAEREKEGSVLCPRCRAFLDGVQDQSILCTECNRVFIYPRELRFYAQMFGWGRPRRCIGGCTRGGTRERNEEEKQMFDFLKRIRASQRGASTGLQVGDLRRTDGPAAGMATGGDKVGGSLADALKEFQAKKRRGPRR